MGARLQSKIHQKYYKLSFKYYTSTPTLSNLYSTYYTPKALKVQTTCLNQLKLSYHSPINILLIDNFDSFSWNLYQSLCLITPDAKLQVICNNVISSSAFPLLNIKFLVISPGPGHPHTDSGISHDVDSWAPFCLKNLRQALFEEGLQDLSLNLDQAKTPTN